MVDYSGIAVDTYKMAGGLFDAYNKSLTDRQNREKTAAGMERAAYATNRLRQIENAYRSGSASQTGTVAGLLGSEQTEQALAAMKMPAESWHIGGQRPTGLQSAAPQFPAQLPPVNRMSQHAMPITGQLPLNLVRLWNQDLLAQRATPAGIPGKTR